MAIDINDMSNEELTDYYQEVQEDWLFEELLDRMEGLIVKFAGKWKDKIPNTDFDDVKSELSIAFLDVVRDFDVETGNKLTTLCRSYFKQALYDLNRRKRAKKRYDPDNVPSSLEKAREEKRNGREEDGDLSLSIPCNDFSNVELYEFLEEIGLKANEEMVVQLLLEGETNKSEIARQVGVSHTMVDNYIDNIKEKYKTGLAGV